MQITYFTLDKNSETFDLLHAFLSLVVAKLSNLKNSRFLDHPVDGNCILQVKSTMMLDTGKCVYVCIFISITHKHVRFYLMTTSDLSSSPVNSAL